MTDKQIIDEERMFECVWCKYSFKESDANFILSENPNECICSGCITEWADNLLCDLKRKEQECEQIKEKYEALKLENQEGYEIVAELKHECEKLKKEIINKNEKIKELRLSVSDLTNRLCYLNAEKSFRIVDLEQALDEIKSICLKDVHTFADGTQLRYDSLDKILNIINKAKGEGF